MNLAQQRWLSLVAPVAFVLGFIGCQKEAPPEPPPVAPRVEGTTLGVAIAGLAGFEVVENGEALVLAPTDGTDGRVTIAAGVEGKVNLVQAVHDHQAEILARPDGVYRGQREMVGPLGTAYYSRGTFTGDSGAAAGVAMEETSILTLHPEGDRILRLEYRYPVGDDSTARLEALMQNVLGELEGVDSAVGETTEGT